MNVFEMATKHLNDRVKGLRIDGVFTDGKVLWVTLEDGKVLFLHKSEVKDAALQYVEDIKAQINEEL